MQITTTQKRKILQRISDIESDISELKKCRAEICKTGYASATMSSGGGSKSYSRLDISKITEAISALTSELKQLRNMLNNANGNNQQGLWQSVLVVYS